MHQRLDLSLWHKHQRTEQIQDGNCSIISSHQSCSALWKNALWKKKKKRSNFQRRCLEAQWSTMLLHAAVSLRIEKKHRVWGGEEREKVHVSPQRGEVRWEGEWRREKNTNRALGLNIDSSVSKVKVEPGGSSAVTTVDLICTPSLSHLHPIVTVNSAGSSTHIFT